MSSRFFDTLTPKTVEFNLGIVHRIYLNNSDEPRQNAETNAYQIIDVKPLNGTLPTIQRSLKARPLFRGISDSITRGDLVLFAYIAKKIYYMGIILYAQAKKPAITAGQVGHGVNVQRLIFSRLRFLRLPGFLYFPL